MIHVERKVSRCQRLLAGVYARFNDDSKAPGYGRSMYERLFITDLILQP